MYSSTFGKGWVGRSCLYFLVWVSFGSFSLWELTCMHCVYLALWTCKVLCGSFLCTVYKFSLIHSFILGGGNCGISTEWGLRSRRFFRQWFWREHCWFWREFVSVDLEADSSDSDNNIFIFIIGIRATSRIKLFFLLLCLDSSCFAVVTEKGVWYDSMDYLSDKYTSQVF